MVFVSKKPAQNMVKNSERRFVQSLIDKPSQQSTIVRRREGDLNSRVQGTVDFESTAIPGYAISACIPPTYKTVIRVMSLGWHDEGSTEGPWTRPCHRIGCRLNR